jgi:hypothetical protein
MMMSEVLVVIKGKIFYAIPTSYIFLSLKNINKNLYEEILYENINKKDLTMITFLCKHDKKKKIIFMQ